MNNTSNSASPDVDPEGSCLKANELVIERRDVTTMAVIAYVLAGFYLVAGAVNIVWDEVTLLEVAVPVVYAAVWAGLGYYSSKLSLWSVRVLISFTVWVTVCLTLGDLPPRLRPFPRLGK